MKKKVQRFRLLLSVSSVLLMMVAVVALVVAQGEQSAVHANGGKAASVSAPNLIQPAGVTGSAVYIIQLKDPSLAAYAGGIAGLAATNPNANGARFLEQSAATDAYLSYLDGVQRAFVSAAGQQLGRTVDVRYTYRHAFNGVAIFMSPEEAAAVAGMPEVKTVFRETQEELLTDAGPGWIGAPSIWDGSATGGLPATQGEGVIVAILDTGINHDHPSFADVGEDGYDHTNPLGSGTYIPGSHCITDPSFCNDKLIGAWDMVNDPSDPNSPEDSDGHGSHTGSTVAGNVVTATVYGETSIALTRTISGVAPHANIIAYDVCITTCPGAALLAAVNQVIADNMAVMGASSSRIVSLNYSISGGASPYTDPVELAFLDATAAGVFVSASAGNAGPGPGTVAHLSPWVMTVAASTHNRALSNDVVSLSGGDTPPPGDIDGQSFATGYGPATIVYAGDFGDALCLNPFASGTFSGEIVVCDRGTNARVDKGANVLAGGAGGMILADNGAGIVADAHFLPATHISLADGIALKTWLASGSGHMGTLTGTVPDTDPSNGDIMAGFSSRGPAATLEVLKPDITAPGVSIWAAIDTNGTTPSPEYGFISGTSMSSPHDAGSAALIAALHPDWTPYQIKSALMTTSYNDSIVKEDGVTPADPFDVGAGRVDLTQAGMAGLVLDETPANFLAANPSGGSIGLDELNIPNFNNANCAGTCSWTRVVSSTQSVPVTWTASVDAPGGLILTVEPTTFVLAPYGTQTITVTADVTALPGGWTFGEVILTPSASGGGGGGGGTDAFTSSPALSVPDDAYNGTLASMACDTIDTSSVIASGNLVTAVELETALDHSWIGDITVKLISPDGSILGVVSRPGMAETADDGTGCCGDSSGLAAAAPVSFSDANSDDAETMGNTISDAQIVCTDDGRCAYFANPGTVVGVANFAGFAGENASGNWQLCMGDSVGGDLGTIQSWTLTISHETLVNSVAPSTQPTFAPTGKPVTSHEGVAVTLPAPRAPEVVLYDQTDSASGNGFPSQDFETAFDIYDNAGADDFVVPAGDGSWTVDTIETVGTNGGLAVPLVNVTFYDDAAGLPGTAVYTAAGVVPVDNGTGSLTITLVPPVVLPEGTYWVSVVADMDFATHGQWFWSNRTVQSNSPAAWINPGNGFGTGCTNWSAAGATCGVGGGFPDALFRLSGTIGGGGGGGGSLPVAHFPVAVQAPEAPPAISIDPTSLSSSQSGGTSVTVPFTITNVGEADLNWNIYEAATGLSLLGGSWSDNFDSYVAGTNLHGQGGWAGWGGSPAAGAIVTDVISLSAPNSVDIVGPSDLVQEYTGYNSGAWEYVAWQYIPSDFSGETYFILVNSYDGGGAGTNWSTQVHFNSVSGEVIADGQSGPLATAPLVTGQWVEIRVIIDLVSDTQFFYYDGQLLYQNSWTEGISGGGALNIAAVDLFANGATSVFYDDISLAPYVLQLCESAGDIPWLSESPTSGTAAGGESDVVNVTFDAASLGVGVYTGTMCVSSNDTNMALIEVPVTLEVTSPPPAIGVSPAALTATVATTSTVTHTLTINNNGGSDLDWNISESANKADSSPTSLIPAYLAGAVSGVAAETVNAQAPVVSADVKGVVPHFVPQGNVLYDNGPLVNSPGTGAGGADESILQSVSLGMNTLGFGHQVSANNSMADDFTIPTGENWTIDAMTFFAYQTGSSTTSTITGMNVELYDGDPSQGANLIASSSTILNSDWSGIYRVTETTPGDVARPIMATVVDFGGLELSAGTYWLEWQANGSLASGPWAPPITINGQSTTGNGLQNQNGTWLAALDGGTSTQQGLPFIIMGSSGCTDDIPWVSVNPSSGTTAAGGSSDVSVVFDSTGYAIGVYTATLCVNSNDPVTPLVTVPVTMTVVEGEIEYTLYLPVIAKP